MAKVDIGIRLATPEDRNFIKRSWMYSRSTLHPLRMAKSVFWNRFGYGGLVDHLVENSEGTNIVIAHAAAHEALILGWAAWTCDGFVNTLEHVFVKEEWRRKGIARELLGRFLPMPERQITYDHPHVRAIWPDAKLVDPFRIHGRYER